MKHELINAGPFPDWCVYESYYYDKYHILFEEMIYKTTRLRVVFRNNECSMPIDWCCGRNTLVKKLMFLILLNAIDNNEFEKLPPHSMIYPVNLDTDFMIDCLTLLNSYTDVITIHDINKIMDNEAVQTWENL